MHITPVEIRQKRFEKKLRGYHTDEVDAFLHSLAYSWEKLLAQSKELQITLGVYKKNIDRLESLEGALLKTIRDADTTSVHMIEQAKKESELIIQEASITADKLIQEAKISAQSIGIEAREDASKLKYSLNQELETMKMALKEATEYQENIFKQLHRLGEELLLKTQTVGTHPSMGTLGKA